MLGGKPFKTRMARGARNGRSVAGIRPEQTDGNAKP